jgi:hypothetical protein
VEVLVPVIIVTIGIGLFLLFLRTRPTVVEPPSNVNAPKVGASKALATADALKLLEELKDAPPGAKRVTIVRKASFSKADLADIEGSLGELLEKLAPGLTPVNAPPEADLQYPGSSKILDSLDAKSSLDASEGSRDVYKTTLATEADRSQVLAWYRDWLLGQGWQPSPSAGTNPESSQEYARGSEHMRLAVADPTTIAPVLAMPIPDGTKTIYEVEYSTISTHPPS